jgi:hypothetical protein
MSVLQYCLLKLFTADLHFSDYICVGSNAPSRVSLGQNVLLHKPEQVTHYSFRIGLKEPFTSNQSDSSEHLHSQLTSCNGADKVDGVFLLFDIVRPNAEDISALVYVDVVFDTAHMSLHCLLVVGLQLFLYADSMLVFSCHLLYNLRLVYFLLILLSLEVFPLRLFLGQKDREFIFLVRKSALGPGTESFGLVVLDPVLYSALKESFSGLEFFQSFDPGVEATSLRGVDKPRNKVSDYLVTLSEQLRLQVMFRTVIDLNLLIEGSNLLFMCSLASL